MENKLRFILFRFIFFVTMADRYGDVTPMYVFPIIFLERSHNFPEQALLRLASLGAHRECRRRYDTGSIDVEGRRYIRTDVCSNEGRVFEVRRNRAI